METENGKCGTQQSRIFARVIFIPVLAGIAQAHGELQDFDDDVSTYSVTNYADLYFFT